MSRSNLHVTAHAHVTKIQLNEANRAIGVEFKNGEKFFRVLTNREIILSAGAVGSPHLLMLSGIGPKAQLENFGVKI